MKKILTIFFIILCFCPILTNAKCKHNYTYNTLKHNARYHKEVLKCKKCNHVKSSVLKGHSYGSFSYKHYKMSLHTKTAKCKDCGYVNSVHEKHTNKTTYVSSGILHNKIEKCTKCGFEIKTLESHTYKNGKCTKCYKKKK